MRSTPDQSSMTSTARPGCQRRDPMVLVRGEHQRLAALESVRHHLTTFFERLERAALESALSREHHVDGDERTHIVVVRIEKRGR